MVEEPRDYNEPISDAGHVVGDGLVQRIQELEAELRAERFRTKVLEEKIEKMREKADGQVSP